MAKKIQFIPPTLIEFKKFFTDNGFPATLAERAWNGYSVSDWHDSNGKPVKNWKQKCFMVWFKDENKVKQQFIPQKQKEKPVQMQPTVFETANDMEISFANAFETYRTKGELPTSSIAARVLFNFINDKCKVFFTTEQQNEIIKNIYDPNKMKLRFYFDSIIQNKKS